MEKVGKASVCTNHQQVKIKLSLSKPLRHIGETEV
jgi:hypothetical protein